MNIKTKALLKKYAARYETTAFLKEDPARFMHLVPRNDGFHCGKPKLWKPKAILSKDKFRARKVARRTLQLGEKRAV